MFEFMDEELKTKLNKKELKQVTSYEKKFLDMHNRVEKIRKKYSSDATQEKQEVECSEDQQKDLGSQENHGSKEGEEPGNCSKEQSEEQSEGKLEEEEATPTTAKSKGSETVQCEGGGGTIHQEELQIKDEESTQIQPRSKQTNSKEVQSSSSKDSSRKDESSISICGRCSGTQGSSIGGERVDSDDDLESMTSDDDDEEYEQKKKAISKHLQESFKGSGGKMKKSLKRKFVTPRKAHIEHHETYTPDYEPEERKQPLVKRRKVIPYTKKNHAKQTLRIMTPQIFEDDSDEEPEDPFANIVFGV